MKICDLHTHSIYSDGTNTPSELIDMATKIGLSSLALSDHNTVDGLKEFIEASKNKDIEIVPGCEFSVDYNGKELHLLGLFINEIYFDDISKLMKEVNDRKDQSNLDLIQKLNDAGYNIDYNLIKQSTPNGKFNRAHVASELVRLGYVKDRDEAFKTLLSKKGPYYKEPERLTVWEMLEYLVSIHAIPVLAHPFLNLNEDELNVFLPIAKDKGLIGIEVYYSLYNEITTNKSIDLANKYDLKYSGGSDYHGENKPDIQLGIGKGNLVIPNEWVKELKNI